MSASKGARRPLGIRTKIFGLFTLFTLFTVLLLWLFQILLLPGFYSATTKHRIAAGVERLLALPMIGAEEETALRLSQDYNAGIHIFHVDDKVATTVLTVDGQPGSVLALLSSTQLNELYAAASGEEDGAWFKFQLREGDFRFAWEMADGEDFEGTVVDEREVYATVGTSSAGKQYFILMDIPLEPIDGTVRVLSAQLVVLTLVLLLLSAILATVIAGHISKPLSYLNIAARRLPRGTYPADYREEAYREVAELSDTLAEAAGEIGKVEALQKELIANISHDLRTPLTMIIGYAEIMRDIEGESTPENMQVIIDEAKRLSDMVGDLVSISRYQGGGEQVELSDFSLSEMAGELLGEYRALLQPSGYSFREEIGGDISVHADRNRILRVLRNLLDNAVNYAGDRREVTLAVRYDVGLVRCEVRDRGEGIAEEDLPYVWQRYYRARGNHERSKSGSGLGLAIVREHLEWHGARYGVESKLGEGTTFWFLLKPAARK